MVTVNCARIILPNQPATNGLIHIVDRIISPISKNDNLMELLTSDGRYGLECDVNFILM